MTRFLLVRSAAALMMVCFAVVLVAPRPTRAEDGPCNWTGAKNMDWREKDNWSNCHDSAPGPDDDVVIMGGTRSPGIDSLHPNPTFANVTLGWDLWFDVGRSLTVSGQLLIQNGGDILGNGTINGPVVVSGGTGRVQAIFNGPITVDAGATLTVNGILRANGNVTVNGTLNSARPTDSMAFNGNTFTNNGTISASTLFRRNGAQTLTGAGQWTGPLLGITSSQEGGASATVLGSNVTFSVDRIAISNGATLAIGAHTMTVDDGAQIYVDGLPSAITGTGTLNLQGTIVLAAGQHIQPKVVIVSGTTSASGTIAGPVEVKAGAVLAVAGGGILSVQGAFKNDGEVTGLGSFTFSGATFTNNGKVMIPSMRFAGATQKLSGVGSFANTNTLHILRNANVTLGSNHALGKLTIYVGATLNITGRTLALTGSGTPLITQGTLVTTNSNVVYRGTVAQTLVHTGVIYHHLTLANAAGTSTASSALLGLRGNWTKNGPFTAGAGSTIAFVGSTAQRIGGGSDTTFVNLLVNNASGVALARNANVNGKLTLTRDLKTGSKVLTMPATATSTGAGDVIGSVRRVGSFAAGTTYSFGNPLVSLTFDSAGTRPSAVIVTLVKDAPTGLSPAVPRRYKITASGGSGYSTTLRLRYLDSEVGGIVEGSLQLYRSNLSTGTWSGQGRTAADTSANWVERSGVAPRGVWAIAP